MNHTPGPWTAIQTHRTRTVIHCGAWMNDGIVAVIHAAGNDGDFSTETAEHNARLIAAAPDLLAACIKMRATMYSPKSEESRMADAAIAKATKGGAT